MSAVANSKSLRELWMELSSNWGKCTDSTSSIEVGQGDAKKISADFSLEDIDARAEEVLKSPQFLELDLETLCEVLQRDTLQVTDETVVYEAALAWARAECARQELDAEQPANWRTVLGKALYHIRFPLMGPVKFAKEVATDLSKLLDTDDIIGILLHFALTGPFASSCTVDFSEKKRQLVQLRTQLASTVADWKPHPLCIPLEYFDSPSRKDRKTASEVFPLLFSAEKRISEAK